MKMKFKPALLVAVVIPMITVSCSKEAWYRGYHSDSSQQCYGKSREDREACLQERSMSYDEYKTIRDQAVKKY